MAKRYVRMDITSTIGTTFGDIVGNCLYGGQLLSLVEEYTGCPHHGGEHSLMVKDTKENLLAWLELFEDVAPRPYHGRGIKLKEVEILRKELDNGNTNIKLKRVLQKQGV